MVAVAASIKTVRVVIGAGLVVAHRYEVFHLSDGKTLGPSGGEVRLVAEAEGASETEFPA